MINQEEKAAIAEEFGKAEIEVIFENEEGSTKHTPGPWDYRFNGHFFDVGILNEGRSLFPIFPSVCIGVPARQEANARLIAAAPELLDALKNFVGSSRVQCDFPDFCEIAEDAIAQAESL